MYKPDKETLVTLVTTAITGCNVKPVVVTSKPECVNNKETIINHSSIPHIKPKEK